MCGRLTVNNSSTLHSYYAGLGFSLKPRYNVAPTESLQLVYDGTVSEARWWLTPSWSKQVDQKYAMFNARCETLASSRAYREPFKRRRAIVPVSSFIEWRTEQGAKQPWLVTGENGALALAALWERWEQGDECIESCTIVTTAAATPFQQIHKRMPVMLAADEWQRWLDCAAPVADDDPLFRPELKQALRLTPISREVNNARHKDPQLLEPTGAELHLAA